ncbi:hypothetical protein [Bdellovibrio sp. ArHS]|uniref:hypothetical protein n=1 Tax=Bdellovibrio sp. ArHS TaxID=1569284 RepID=UPI0025C6016B|nr:hypothetical protein [Bdellovibrio sp. ArHS]
MKNVFGLLFFLLFTSQAYSQGMMEGLTPPSQQRTLLSYTGLFFDKADFPQERASTSYQSMDFSTPVYRTEQQSISLNLSGSQYLVTPAQSEISGLYDIKFGLGYTRVIDEKRLWSVNVRYGSASDKPFESADVSTLGVTAFYSYPDDESSRWLLLVDYSNNRPILNNLPLPGFAYFYNRSKEFRSVIGIPFASFNWQFADMWGWDFFTLVPWVVKTSVYYKVTDFAKLYTGVDFSQITYYLYGRQNKEDRLFYDDKKVFIGLKSPISKQILADLEAGHSFDRRFFVDENYVISPDNAISIGNSYYLKLSLKFIL